MKGPRSRRVERQRSHALRPERRADEEPQTTSPSSPPGNENNAGQEPEPVTSGWTLIARVVWMLLGPMALGIIGLRIVSVSTGWLGGLDAGYFVIVAIMIGCRWMELKSGHAMTATGEPATWSDFSRYVVALVPLAVVVWVVVNVLGNHVRPGL